MRRDRSRSASAGFLVIWMVLWTAAILTAVWHLGSAALGGEIGAAVALLIWVAAAGFGLFQAAQRLLQLLVTGRPRPPGTRRWEDGMNPPEDGAGH